MQCLVHRNEWHFPSRDGSCFLEAKNILFLRVEDLHRIWENLTHLTEKFLEVSGEAQHLVKIKKTKVESSQNLVEACSKFPDESPAPCECASGLRRRVSS